MLVEEWIDGTSLTDRLEADGPMLLDQALALLLPVVDALGWSTG